MCVKSSRFFPDLPQIASLSFSIALDPEISVIIHGQTFIMLTTRSNPRFLLVKGSVFTLLKMLERGESVDIGHVL